jgi:Rps23 Pro-64 3,4-dihydroxylase Tpa1-like proline 4-hydroxylase
MTVINNDCNYKTLKMNTYPFPYLKVDNFLETEFALDLQTEILNIPNDQWDRYANPFEQKYTLRDKYNFSCNLKKLFDELTSDNFVLEISEIVGYKLKLDETRNFWGVHAYGVSDKLDIHVDAGLHPTLGLKKQVTLGVYISYNWKEEYGCNLEIWKGENSCNNNSKILEKVDSIPPLFNRLVLFTCNDYSWHGNPEPANCPENSKRIFVTISYLSENYEDKNKRSKAFFVKRPKDENNEEKDRLRLLRADPDKCKYVYKL